MSSKSLSKRRKNLMNKDPHCYYCGCEVIYKKLRHGEKMPDNFATIDHLNSKLMGVRPIDNWTRVLCCNKCNKNRNDKELSALSKEDLWRRSGRFPMLNVFL